MLDLRDVLQTGFFTVQKLPNLHKTFRTRGCQTSILGAVARPKHLNLIVFTQILTERTNVLKGLQISGQLVDINELMLL